MSKRLTTFFIFCFCLGFTFTAISQNVTIQGYVFEEGNRGFLNLVKVQAFDVASGQFITEAESDQDGVFLLDLPPQGEYKIVLEKRAFEKKEEIISTTGKDVSKKIFARYPMLRKPGYLFEVTIAEAREDDSPVDAIQGARIEVYNNTTKKEVLNLIDHPNPTFNVNFEQGNHYTILIRKDNFYNKRMEAYVNVKGCILCFEGIGSVVPGVSDVLTEGNKMGTLLANVELEPLVMNKAIKFENIYYDYNSSRIKSASKVELDKLINILKINPSLIVELSSHTDSRGKDSYNLRLSQKRAEAAATYVTAKGGIDPDRIRPRGYGENKLVNRCKNGVECSEEKHQENRRTEFKIIGFRKDRFHDMSLVDILEEERREKLIKELQNQEVIKVEEGEELPEEIKRQFAGNKAESKEAEAEEMVTDKTKGEATETPAADSNLPVKEVGKEAIKPPVKSEIIHHPEAAEDNSTPPTNEQPSDPMENNAFKTTSEDFSETTAGSLIVEEQEVEISETRILPKELPEDYTGYKVEFYSAAYELPRSHEIFSRHGNITKEMKKDGSFAYLLGDFTDWKAANSFLNKIMVSRYPDARIIRYRKGKRLK